MVVIPLARLSIAILLCLFSSSLGWLQRAVIPANSEYPGQCFVQRGSLNNGEPLYDLVLSDQESVVASIGNCFKIECQSQGVSGFELLITGCGTVSGPPGCLVVENKELPFPECCPRIVCLEDEGSHRHYNNYNTLTS